MTRFIIRRTIYALITLFILSLTIFCVIRLTGDPVSLLAEPGARDEDLAIAPGRCSTPPLRGTS